MRPDLVLDKLVSHMSAAYYQDVADSLKATFRQKRTGTSSLKPMPIHTGMDTFNPALREEVQR
jgi:hypothetical protein